MWRANVVTLIGESPDAHGVFSDRSEFRRTVRCTVGSVGLTESYQARAQGLYPSIRVKLANYREYKDERVCEFEGVTYRILRTYITDDDGIELTLERGNDVPC